MAKKIDFSNLNLQDALDLAILIEEEAKERYEEFAKQIGSTRTGDAGSFFASMAENEDKHGRELAAQRKNIFGTRPSVVTIDMIDEVSEVEAPEYSQARSFMSKKHALEVALACEVKAYNFFAKALPQLKNDEVKKLFTELKAEEVAHQNLIKDLLQRTSDSMDPEVEPGDVDEPSGL
ncbi:MAG: hypothetical protein A2X86_02040 [Bdellovibrionales bacterium GWA2_49_15]|nr:MAG: hypothetical protein A2X86_02040 [Bdellovibrionales bacterium GWA2_49_15]